MTATAIPGLVLRALHKELQRLAEFRDVGPSDLAVMQVKGLAHDHIEIRGHDALLRVPKQSQFGLAAGDNLTYQTACFERVAESGRCPSLRGVIPPSDRVSLGALIVDHIHGRPPRLPDDLPALAETMARVHALALRDPAARPPLEDHLDPVADALQEIEQQARFLPDAGLAIASRSEIESELAWARQFQASGTAELGRQPQTLVLTDTHPGNFLIDAAGRAIIVDLEKALYGSPGTDLAHATIYSSTTWDPDVWAVLDVREVAAFYRTYLDFLHGCERSSLAEALRRWLLPMRRLLFLRAITWCVKWQVLHSHSRKADKYEAANTEDWSAENSDPALIAHVAGRVKDYLSPETLRNMRSEWTDPASPLHSLSSAA